MFRSSRATIVLAALITLVQPLVALGADVVINEVMYHPTCGPEWVELYNPGPDPANLSGLLLTDNEGRDLREGEYWLPDGTVLAPDAYLVVGAFAAGCPTNDPALDLRWIPSLRLRDLGDEVYLVEDPTRSGIFSAEEVVDGVVYLPRWGGDGDGHSLAREEPSCEVPDASCWSASAGLGGTPGFDNDHITDIQDPPVYYPDADGDGFGDESQGMSAETQPEGYTDVAGDCDDTDPDVNPAAPESCGGADEDCDGNVDEGYDQDGDGVTSCGGDCNDQDSLVQPEAAEVCDGVDSNCDGYDEPTLYLDRDGDGYGGEPSGTYACEVDEGMSLVGGDCDDTEGRIHPDGDEEPGDTTDFNCDGLIQVPFRVTDALDLDLYSPSFGRVHIAAEAGSVSIVGPYTTCEGGAAGVPCLRVRLSDLNGSDLPEPPDGTVVLGPYIDFEPALRFEPAASVTYDFDNRWIHLTPDLTCERLGAQEFDTRSGRPGDTLVATACDLSRGTVTVEQGHFSSWASASHNMDLLHFELSGGRREVSRGETITLELSFYVQTAPSEHLAGDPPTLNVFERPGPDSDLVAQIEEPVAGDPKDRYWIDVAYQAGRQLKSGTEATSEVLVWYDGTDYGPLFDTFNGGATDSHSCSGDILKAAGAQCIHDANRADGCTEDVEIADCAHNCINLNRDEEIEAREGESADLLDCVTLRIYWTDDDGDGYSPDEGDCKDDDSTVNPGADELCDGKDTNCDGVMPENEIDQDGDGYMQCDGCEGGIKCGDCDDRDSDRSPGLVERCDGKDNDCQGPEQPVDELDKDRDGVRICAGDCNDTDPTVYPDAPELCDGQGNGCRGTLQANTPADELDPDDDGYMACSGCQAPLMCDDCDNDNTDAFPGHPEMCDDADNDCNGQVDEDPLFDSDGDGFYVCARPSLGKDPDCNDRNAAVNPGATEVCDRRVDNDCDGSIDEGLDQVTHLADLDGDGYGAIATACVDIPHSASLKWFDCDDTQASIHPGAAEITETPGPDRDTDCGGTLAAQPTVGLPGSAHNFIAEALAAAAPGETVWVGPGTYDEGDLRIGRGVKLRSVFGATQTTINAIGHDYGLLLDAASGADGSTLVEGFTITRAKKEGVRISQTSPELRQVRAEGNDGGGILAEGRSGAPSTAQLSTITALDNGNYGIKLVEFDGEVAGCEVSGNTHIGVWLYGGIQPTLSHCAIHDNGGYGIKIDYTFPIIEHSVVAYNHSAGLWWASPNLSVDGFETRVSASLFLQNSTFNVAEEDCAPGGVGFGDYLDGVYFTESAGPQVVCGGQTYALSQPWSSYDPEFVDGRHGDFHPIIGSAAIDDSTSDLIFGRGDLGIYGGRLGAARDFDGDGFPRYPWAGDCEDGPTPTPGEADARLAFECEDSGPGHD